MMLISYAVKGLTNCIVFKLDSLIEVLILKFGFRDRTQASMNRNALEQEDRVIE